VAFQLGGKLAKGRPKEERPVQLHAVRICRLGLERVLWAEDEARDVPRGIVFLGCISMHERGMSAQQGHEMRPAVQHHRSGEPVEGGSIFILNGLPGDASTGAC
jgi:hypothetical protein